MRPDASLTGLFLFGLLLAGGCQNNPPVTTHQFLAFGTLVDLTIAGIPQQQALQATEIIENDFTEMHKAWHAWDPGPLGRVNRLIQTGKSFSVPPMVMPLITRGQELSAKSDHLFNPAIGRLIDVWGFHNSDPDGHQPPSPETIT